MPDAPESGLSIVVPVFNEEGGIAGTVEALLELSGSIEAPLELVFVNDGSMDGTRAILDGFGDRIEVFHHNRNRGYGAALKTGIARARFDHVAICDADGTYPIDRIPDLYQRCAAERRDMVVGARTGTNVTYSKLRRIPKWFLRRYINWIARDDIPDFNSGLRVFRREVALKYAAILPDGFSFTTTITLALKCNRYDVAYVPIDYFERTGSSHIKPFRDTLRFVQLIARTGMYFAPLRILGPLIPATGLLFLASLGYDIAIEGNLGDKSVLLMVLFFNVTLFAALADMISRLREIR